MIGISFVLSHLHDIYYLWSGVKVDRYPVTMTTTMASPGAIYIIVLELVAWIVAQDLQTVAKTTSLGTLQGYSEHVLDKDMHIFLGIPFAKPPTGERRFRKPEPVGEWSGTLDATKLPNSCPQTIDTSFDNHLGVTMWNANTKISEDCLYLNIWTPSSDPPSGGRPVMVWIYGGGFYAGTSTLGLYDGRILSALGDVIVVSMQYRVGSLGFLTLGTEKIPGNVGMFDQVLALKWIQDNIDEYGGDPSRVTIFGESAGAVSVGLHLVSPTSRDLFERAILQSSSVLSPWAVDSESDALRKSINMAAAVGCSNADLDALADCLLEIPHELFTEKLFTQEDDSMLDTPLVPTVDGDFLPKNPIEIFQEKTFKRTGILIGMNKNEGAYFLPFALPSLYKLTPRSIHSKEAFLRAAGVLLNTEDQVMLEVVAFEYQEPYHYRAGQMHYMDMLDGIVGDYCFKCPVVNFAKAYANADQDVYFYKFTHDISSNPWPDWMGVLHGYEIDTVFGLALNQSLTGYSQPERDFSKRVAQHWINFAVKGDPSLTRDQTTTPYTWPAYTASDRNVLVLNLSAPAAVLDGIRDRKCAFWDNLVQTKLINREDNPTCGCVRSHATFVVMAASIVLSYMLSSTAD